MNGSADKVHTADGSLQPGDPLATLRSLLVGEEQRQIEHISERLDDPGLRSGELAEVLPASLRLAGQRGEELADALEDPVTTCIQRSIRRDPDHFADALYPVMGPAIRQSITNTLKELVDNINRTLEHSLSSRGLKWRFEAMRSGVPFAEVVLRHTLAYRVEQVFLIQDGSGLLMQHVHDAQALAADADAVSGMLTAIAQFVRDAFQAGDREGLETVHIGEHTVLLVHGPQAYLACVVRGMLPAGLRRHCNEVMEQLHRRHRKALSAFDGDPETLAQVRPLLESCLMSEARPQEGRRGPAPATVTLLLLLLLALGWVGYRGWSDWQSEQRLHASQQVLIDSLASQPGIVLTRTHFDGHVLRVHGLRDPLAASPTALLQRSGLHADQVEFDFRPYMDLDPAFVLQRARSRLAPPASVRLTLDGQGGLHAEGVADQQWIERAAWLAPGIPGVLSWSANGLVDRDRQLLDQARRLLSPPTEVELGISQGVLTLSGHAPQAWIGQVDALLDGLEGLQGLVLQLQSDEQLQFHTLQRRLDGSRLTFTEGAALLDEAQLRQAQALAAQLHRLLGLANQLGTPLRIQVTGSTDGIGLAALNEQLAMARALYVRDFLIGQGVPDTLLQLLTRVRHDGIPDPELRRVDLRVLTPGS